jgi:hypothetical protein
MGDAYRALEHLDLPAGWSSDGDDDIGALHVARSAPAATGLGSSHPSLHRVRARQGREPGGSRRAKQQQQQQQQQHRPAAGPPPRRGASLSRASSLSPATSLDAPQRLLLQQLSGSTTPASSASPASGETPHLLRRRPAPSTATSSSTSSSAGAAAAAAAPPSARLLSLLEQHCLADSDLVPPHLAPHQFCAIKQLARQFHGGLAALDIGALAQAALAGRYDAAAWLPAPGALPLGRFMCAACRRFIVTGSVHMHMALPGHWGAVGAALGSVCGDGGGGGGGEPGGLAGVAGQLVEALQRSYGALEQLQQQACRAAGLWGAGGGELEVPPLVRAGLLEQVEAARAGLARCLLLQVRLEALLLAPSHARCEGAGEVPGRGGGVEGAGAERCAPGMGA